MFWKRSTHSAARRSIRLPRNSSAPAAGFSTLIPARIARPSVAAARNLSASSATTVTLVALRSSASLPRTILLTSSTDAPERIYSSASISKLRHRAVISMVRLRSACTASSLDTVTASSLRSSLTFGIFSTSPLLSISSICLPTPTSASAGTETIDISYGSHLVAIIAGPVKRPSSLTSFLASSVYSWMR